MPASKLSLDFKGLVTAPGQLAAPPGSLTIAQNVDFPAPGLAEKRRGVQAGGTQFTTGACWSVITSKALGDNLLFNTGNAGGSSDQAASLQYGDGTSAPTTLTTPDTSNFSNSPDARMKMAVSLKNHFLTSYRATGRLESDLSFKYAGMPRPFGIYGAAGTTLSGSGTAWLLSGNGVAYRIVIGTTDADGVVRLSSPSGRFTISNIAGTTGFTGASRSVVVRVMAPYQSDTRTTALTTSYFYQIYRSIQSTVASAQPNDELQLCFQRYFNAGDIAAGYVDVIDTCPEQALGAYLYTNTVSGGDVLTGLVRPNGSGIGIGAANDRPPLAKDIAQYGNCLWYANITTPQRQVVSMLAVGAGGVAVGDVIGIGGRNYTGVVGAPASASQFKVETGLASTALNIKATCQNLCEAINRDTGQTAVTATYIGSDSSPGTIGQMLFENRRTDDASFNLSTTGVSTAFVPDLLTASSTQDVWGNGLAISKPFQGDAVPPANYLRVGRNDTVIQRIIPLRDALFIFTDDGIYWARGNTPADFAIDQFDTTFRILAREACVAVGDAIYAWGFEGIARITSGGVEYLDLPIRNTVQNIQRGLTSAITLSSFQQRAFAVAYRNDRKVLFFFPQGNESGGFSCSRALVFHIPMNAWSIYRFDPEDNTTANGKLSGVVRYKDDLLHLGEYVPSGNSYLYSDRAKVVAVTNYTDSNSSAQDIAITSILEWTSCVPDAATLCHWVEGQCFWSPPDSGQLGLPTSVAIQFTIESGGTTSTTMAPSVIQTRVPLGYLVGLGARMVMQVTHGRVDDYFSMSGMGLLYHPISNLNVRGS